MLRFEGFGVQPCDCKPLSCVVVKTQGEKYLRSTSRIFGTRKAATSSGSSARQLMKNLATFDDVEPDMRSSAWATHRKVTHRRVYYGGKDAISMMKIST